MTGIGPISPPLGVNVYIGAIDPRVFTGANTLGANNSYAFAFKVDAPVTVANVRTYIGVSNGNLEMALATGAPGGNLTEIATTGSVASPGTGQRAFALVAPVTLLPGVLYWQMVATDSATLTLPRIAGSGWGPLVPTARSMVAYPIPDPYTGTGVSGSVFGFWFY